MKYLFSVSFAFFFNLSFCQIQSISHGGGTSIFALVTKDTIWLAADSKGNNTSYSSPIENPKSKTKFFTECKIGKTDNIYYAFTGNFVYAKKLNGKLIFSSDSIIKQSVIKCKTFEKSIIDFDVIIKKKLNETLAIMKSLDPKHFVAINNLVLLEGIIVSFFDAVPKFKYMRYDLKEANETFEIISNKDNGPDHYPFSKPIGYNEAIIESLKNPNSLHWKIKGKKEQLIYLINLEVERHPDFVGAPIDILSITNKGCTWLTQNKECQYCKCY